MKFSIRYYFICLFLIANVGFTNAQSYVISGKVTDAQTNEPIPFANIALKGKNTGVTTDFDGKYTLKTNILTDSIWVTYLGYQSKTKAVQKNTNEQTIDFQMVASSTLLREVVVYRGENPAYPILRKVIANKDQLNRDRLEAYQFESYSKTELDVDNMSDKFRNRKAMKQVMEYMDKLQKIAGEDGKPILPVFVSEMVSRQYFKSSPKATKTEILKTHLTGVGLKDESVLTQLLGGSFLPFNFSDNWIRILGKDFMSPIAEGCRSTYSYYLSDSVQVGLYNCYQIDYEPKRPQDLAFRGKIWIDKATFALVEIDATISKEANLNFIDKITIQQELEPSQAGPWLPVKMRTLLDVGQMSENSAGMLAKYYVQNKDIVINKPQPAQFYADRVEVEEDVQSDPADSTFWKERRQETQTADERKVYQMIDSLKNLPIVRSYIDIADLLINGYIKSGPIEFGPIPLSYAYNNIEGSRLRFGFRTNNLFSKNLYLKGYMAYGTKDQIFKYNIEANYILSRKPFTTIGFRTNYELERLGVNADEVGANNLFLAFNRFGRYNRGFYQHENYGYVKTTLFKGFEQTVGFRVRDFAPLYHFGYYANPELGTNSAINTNFQSSEFVFESRYAPDEVVIQNDRRRVEGKVKGGRRGIPKWPVFTFRYTLGLKTLGGDFDYHRFQLGIQHSFRLGIVGRTYYNIVAGTSPSRVPYPLLFPHLGNNSVFFTDNSYNQMNIGEFVSTSFVALRVRHDLEGFLFNRIPIVRKWKLRTDLLANIIVGENNIKYREIHPVRDPLGAFYLHPNAIRPSEPYIELGYGVNNIFKFLRVEFVHRVTYLNTPYRINPFGIKFAVQFRL